MQLNRMLYPFREETLMTLWETKYYLQFDLNLNKGQTDFLVSSSTSTASDIGQVSKSRSDRSKAGPKDRLGLISYKNGFPFIILSFCVGRDKKLKLYTYHLTHALLQPR
ncbi:hypothetical protein BDV29DRAFT_114861 [Aspergillus leporis]|uniref:Uncharacterized protein n=1 Tax=Aspergillus leporis TaxID=41062 RepID=A0A5N5X4I9_9EURO|nr:hypothetical protein BDV29DRAFT_114861 [Aspergillus leporis]